jgi:tetratricopeptide (TPR) repeat protein
MNLATALANLGRGQQAERILEQGVAAYPYAEPLTARLAEQYAMDQDFSRARKLVEQYRSIFPEDPQLRAIEKDLLTTPVIDPLSVPKSTTPFELPR